MAKTIKITYCADELERLDEIAKFEFPLVLEGSAAEQPTVIADTVAA